MSHLLDASFILACAWSNHRDHLRANRWLNAAEKFATAPITQMAFLRVSMSAAYGASYVDARRALSAIIQMKAHLFVSDSIEVDALPEVLSNKDVTDAHFVTLAGSHGMKLATLDNELCKKPWAKDIAENPLGVQCPNLKAGLRAIIRSLYGCDRHIGDNRGHRTLLRSRAGYATFHGVSTLEEIEEAVKTLPKEKLEELYAFVSGLLRRGRLGSEADRFEEVIGAFAGKAEPTGRMAHDILYDRKV